MLESVKQKQKNSLKIAGFHSTDVQSSCLESNIEIYSKNSREICQQYKDKNRNQKVYQLKLKMKDLEIHYQKMIIYMDQCVKLLQLELQKRGKVNEQLKTMIANMKKQIQMLNKDILKLGKCLQLQKNMEQLKVPAWRLSLNIQKHDDYQINKQLASSEQKNNFQKALRKSYGQVESIKLYSNKQKNANLLFLFPESQTALEDKVQKKRERKISKSKSKTKSQYEFQSQTNQNKRLKKSISSRQMDKY